MKVKLGDICTITSSKRIFESEYVPDGVPFIRGLEISNGSILDENAVYECYISRKRFEELKKTNGVPQQGDILITAVGTIGNLCYINKAKDFYFKDGNVIWFKDFRKDVYSKFLFYYMKSDYFKKQLEYSLIGAVQKALTMVMLAEIELDLPDYSTQKMIAAALEDVDAKIENNNAICADLEDMAKLLYDYWFVQFDFPDENGKPYKSSGGKKVWSEELKREIPEGWEVCSLSSITETERGVSYTEADLATEGVPLISLASIGRDGNYIPSAIKFYGGEYKESKILKPYDLVMCNTDMTQERAMIGKCILVPDIFGDGPILSTHHITRIFVSDDILKLYIALTTQTKWFHKCIQGFCSGTNVLGLDMQGFNQYLLLVPPKHLLKQFNKKVFAAEKMKNNLILENRDLAFLRDFLLPMLMNGQVKVGEGA